MLRRFTIATSLVLTLALAAFSASPTLADSKAPGGLDVVSYTVVGSTVQVVVGNSSSAAKGGSVEVVASVLGFPVRSSKPVQVQGQGSTVVSVGFVLPVTDVTMVGIVIDDNIPF